MFPVLFEQLGKDLRLIFEIQIECALGHARGSDNVGLASKLLAQAQEVTDA